MSYTREECQDSESAGASPEGYGQPVLHDMFALGPSVAEKILRSVLIYAFLLVALRIGGKRELGQLNTMDVIVLFAVANAVQNGIIGEDNSITGAVIGATTLFVVNEAVALASARSTRVHRVLVGAPTVLVQDGEPVERALRRERISLDDLLQAVVQQGYSSLEEVQHCVIEPGGQIVVTARRKPPS